MRFTAVIVSLVFAHALSGQAAEPPAEGKPKPAAADKIVDRFVPADFEQQKIGGLLGERMKANLEGRLLHVDEKALLAGFQKRPGSHPWIGEHVGKFFDAAANTWLLTHDERLKAMLDRMAPELIKGQLPDGYLGTYLDKDRWTSWDVWSHKYNLIGLLRIYELTGSQDALNACRKMGDLLCNTFGDEPGKRDIIKAGEHVGMAATSVLEPMCRLYRATGEKRYLDFCYCIVRAYDQPHGPKILASLAETHSVFKTANGKAYEMLSNLVGLLELYRLTGDQRFMTPAVLAWVDIVSDRLYITGTTSSHEHFRDDHDLPADAKADVGEGCVTTTWIQLNWELLRLTGAPAYADELERTVYNHLLGAQDPTSGNYCYFTNYAGRKAFGPGINCCVSSLPRGVSLIPGLIWGSRDGGIQVNLYTPGEATILLRAGDEASSVKIKSETEYPKDGKVVLTIEPKAEAAFPLFLRVPTMSDRFEATFGGEKLAGTAGKLLKIERTWKPGDRVEITMDLPVQVLGGGKSYPKCVAIRRGPQVLVLDKALNPELGDLALAGPATMNPADLHLREAADRIPEKWLGKQAYQIDGLVATRDGDKVQISPKPLVLVPFADAREYVVWLGRPDLWTPEKAAEKTPGK